MGKVDSVTKEFLRDNTVFADAFNYLIYDGEQVLSFVENYNIHLITPESLETTDLVKFKSKLRDVLEYIKCSNNEELMNRLSEDERFVSMDYETAQLLSVCLGIKLEEELEKGETVNMCKAWDDHWKSGKQAGICEGEIKGLVFSVHNLMESMNFSREKAMEVLKVPVEQRDAIIKLLQSA